MLVITLLLLGFLFILFILFTAIGLTFKIKVLSLGEKKEFKGKFTVKWLLFSHTFSVEEPEERENLFEELENSKQSRTIKEKQSGISMEGTEKIQVNIETQNKTELKRKEEIKEKEVEEEKIEINKKSENKERRGIIARIMGKKKPEIEEKAPEMEMTTKEKLQWGLNAYKALNKPLFRLFSDLLNGIKIKRLESYMTFGLSDPADTGMLCGCIHAVAGLVYSRCRHCSFSINPVFTNPMIDFRGGIEIRVRIYCMIYPMVKFMLNGKTLSFTYSIIKEKLWGERKFLS